MKKISTLRRFIRFGVIALIVLATSCSNRILSRNLRALHGRDSVTVVLYGPPLTGGRWMGGMMSPVNRNFADKLGELLDARVSVINNSAPDATYVTAINYFGELFTSYRPDIVILMLGSRDATMTGISSQAYREYVEELLTMFRDEGIFTVVLTGVGYQSFNPGYDRRLERLGEYNEITIWKALDTPVIDIGANMKRIRETAPEEFRAMFASEYVLNDSGKEYVFDFLLARFRKVID